jgi:hypothetical protein
MSQTSPCAKEPHAFNALMKIRLSHQKRGFNSKRIQWKHRALQNLLGDEDFICEQEHIYVCKDGTKVIAHPDVIYKYKSYNNSCEAIVEIKTTESRRVIKEPYQHHITQTKMYMSILNASYGVILYMLLGYSNKVTNYFPEHLVLFSYAREKQEILDKLERDAINLRYGLDHKDASQVKHSATDPTFINFGRNWLCASCDFKKQCDRMRAEAGEI